MKQKKIRDSPRSAPERDWRDFETAKREIGAWYERYEKESAWLASATARVNDFFQRQSVIDQEYKALKDTFKGWLGNGENVILYHDKEAGAGDLFFRALRKFVGFARASKKSSDPAVLEGIAAAERIMGSWDGMDIEAEKQREASGNASAISPRDSGKILRMLEEMGCPLLDV